MESDMTRRTFLKKSSLVLGAAVLSTHLELFNASPARGDSHPFKPHAFLEIGTDDTITVWVGQTDLGQGTHTGIPMIIADELDAAWETVQVKMALAAEPFKDPQWHAQLTGGSTSIRRRWDMLRKVGAAARQMLAKTACFESFAAHMAEVSVDKKNGIRVHKMACAIDCGTAVCPDAVRAQAEAGVVMGMSVAFYEQVRFENGGVKTANYDSYPLLTLAEVPEIEVYIAQNNLKAGGVGEPVFPSVAPAVSNAVFKATGVRLRELPFNQALLAG